MQNKSKKGFTLVEIMIVVVIIGLLAAMAVPAFQKVRETSQQKTVLNNLRQLASASQQYFLENGSASSVAYAELVGTDKYVTSMKEVADEDYSTTFSTITNSVTSLSIDVNGDAVVYTF